MSDIDRLGAAIATAIQGLTPPPAPPPAAVPIQQTSLDEYQQSEATVRFRKFTLEGNTAYQRHQQAGFTMVEAQRLRREGVADIVHVREDIRDLMVTK